MNKLTLSSSPHIMTQRTTRGIMCDVIIALSPALVMSFFIFGVRAIIMSVFCVFVSLLMQFLFELLCGFESEVFDMSAAVTGLLLAFNLPPSLPFWQAAVGCFLAIIVSKELFGGIGKNFANPAILARCVLLVSFPTAMTTYTYDSVSTATPLYSMANGNTVDYVTLLFGFHGGCIGETCAAALIIGGVYLICRRTIHIISPLCFIGGVYVMTLILSGFDFYYSLCQILSGGVMLAAFFMVTDYSTTPPTPLGKGVFSVICAVICVLIRQYGVYPEGLSFAILIANILCPYISRLCRRRVFTSERRRTA